MTRIITRYKVSPDRVTYWKQGNFSRKRAAAAAVLAKWQLTISVVSVAGKFWQKKSALTAMRSFKDNLCIMPKNFDCAPQFFGASIESLLKRQATRRDRSRVDQVAESKSNG